MPIPLFNNTLVKLQYHDFTSDQGHAEFGTEFDIFVKMPLSENYYLETKYANYQAENFATDTQRFIFGAGIKF